VCCGSKNFFEYLVESEKLPSTNVSRNLLKSSLKLKEVYNFANNYRKELNSEGIEVSIKMIENNKYAFNN